MLFITPAIAAAPAAERVRDGQRIYQQFCLYCHGPKMVNIGKRASDLRRFPHDQPERFYTAVRKGKGQMPAWGDILKDHEIDALWEYVKTGGKS